MVSMQLPHLHHLKLPIPLLRHLQVHPAINLSSHTLLESLISTEPVISSAHAPQPTPVQKLLALVPGFNCLNQKIPFYFNNDFISNTISSYLLTV